MIPVTFHLNKLIRLFVTTVVLLPAFSVAEENKAWTPEQLNFFENKIRPILIERCYDCHSTERGKTKGGLLLDTAAGVLKGGETAPAVVPGDVESSLLIKAIRYQDDNLLMPPKGKLTAQQVADFEAWVKMGAPDPRVDVKKTQQVDMAKVRAEHWAFKPPQAHKLPKVKNKKWCQTPVDYFIAAKLDEKKLTPSPPADKRTLLRRATYDLTGLPPTAEEIDAFERDTSKEAYARVLDRLLASPHYGERWGRHWLDITRYADTKGLVVQWEDTRLVFAHAYRDWVVSALNQDMPYDEFVVRQLAADQLPTAGDKRTLAAQGLLTCGPRFVSDFHDIIDDRIDVIGRGLLGLTLTCARCHDHKFDPLPTADYYSLYGVLRGSIDLVEPMLDQPERTPAFEAFEAELKKRQGALDAIFARRRDELFVHMRTRFTEYLKACIDVEKLPGEQFTMVLGPNDINPFLVRQFASFIFRKRAGFDPVFAAWHAFADMPQKELAEKAVAWLEQNKARLNPRIAAAFASPPATLNEVAERYGAIFTQINARWLEAVKANPQLQALPEAADEALRQVLYGADSPVYIRPGTIHDLEWYFNMDARVEMGKLQMKIDEWICEAEGAAPYVGYVVDAPFQENPRVFKRGNPATRGEEVPRRFLAALSSEERVPFQNGSGRLELAQAIVSKDNPLTARVIVNRVWQRHFGFGLVRTPSDFGVRGEPPTHPELLDWLALQFSGKDGWSLKKLHRLIMLSNTYKQASGRRPDLEAADPENKLLGRMNLQRLDFESMRDSMLAISGRLDRTIGGRPKYHRVPNPGYQARFTDLSVQRRTFYSFIDRLNLAATFRTFDVPTPEVHSSQRNVTTVPPQALYLMNNYFVREQAHYLVKRPEVDGCSEPEARIQMLYRLVFGRPATAAEVALGRKIVDAPMIETVAAASPVTPGETQLPALTPWEKYAQVLLLTNEFVFVD